MFRGLINDAKSAAGSVIAKYLARASVAAPFIVALGFATAAITLTLVDRFGSIAAYWMVAGGFMVIGLITSFVVSFKEQEEEAAEKQAEQRDTAGVATDTAAQAAAQLPIAALGALFTAPGGAAAAVGGIRMLARNLPLVVLLALLALLFWPTEQRADAEEADAEVRKPNGMHPPAGHDMQRDAA
jgi:predicted histidine transporter YuiF (NhaC family)